MGIFSYRMPEGIERELRRRAQEEGRSVAFVLTRILTRALELPAEEPSAIREPSAMREGAIIATATEAGSMIELTRKAPMLCPLHGAKCGGWGRAGGWWCPSEGKVLTAGGL